ncbi:MAG: NAD-dependent epimerase [Draconibacterium sp.]
MKILITGTAGFIGFHLAKKLLERGDTVIGIDNINDYYDVNLKYARLADAGISREAEQWNTPVQSSRYPHYTFVRMNLEDREQLNQLFENQKPDKVCNLAAQAGVRYSIDNPHAYINSNVVGFVNLLEACRNHKIQHLVFASSSSVYGNSTKMPLSTTDPVDHPISLYAATKKSNELMAFTYSHLFGIPATGLRFFTVYGPWGRPDMAYFSFTKAILRGKPIKVFNNGDLYRDFTYIDDIVEGITRVIDSPPSTKTVRYGLSSSKEEKPRNEGEVVVFETLNPEPATPYAIYNIGNASPVLLGDFITAIENELGKKAIKEYLPMQPGDVYRTEADVTPLMTDFGYKPETDVQNGIAAFIAWYKRYYDVSA